MNVKLRTEQHFQFLSLKMGCRGSSESTCVKMPHCWKSHELAQLRDCTVFLLQNFWQFVSKFTHGEVIAQLKHLGQITTEIGFCRVRQ